jgi:hypothetical protein
MEEDWEVPPDPAAHPHPTVVRDKAKTEADRRAWAAYPWTGVWNITNTPRSSGATSNRVLLCVRSMGKGSLWRLGQAEAARQIFSRMMELNPRDNQGVRLSSPISKRG